MDNDYLCFINLLFYLVNIFFEGLFYVVFFFRYQGYKVKTWFLFLGYLLISLMEEKDQGLGNYRIL